MVGALIQFPAGDHRDGLVAGQEADELPELFFTETGNRREPLKVQIGIGLLPATPILEGLRYQGLIAGTLLPGVAS